jgi:hypothetical protein
MLSLCGWGADNRTVMNFDLLVAPMNVINEMNSGVHGWWRFRTCGSRYWLTAVGLRIRSYNCASTAAKSLHIVVDISGQRFILTRDAIRLRQSWYCVVSRVTFMRIGQRVIADWGICVYIYIYVYIYMRDITRCGHLNGSSWLDRAPINCCSRPVIAFRRVVPTYGCK